MRLDEQLDETLRRLPAWDPPPDFATRVAAAARATVEWPVHESRARVWAGSLFQGLSAAALGTAVGVAVWASLDPYLRLMTAAADVAIMQPLAVSWTCAAFSLVTAAAACFRGFDPA